MWLLAFLCRIEHLITDVLLLAENISMMPTFEISNMAEVVLIIHEGEKHETAVAAAKCTTPIGEFMDRGALNTPKLLQHQ